MSTGQQIIKVIAIIFGIVLIVNIFGWIIFGLSTFLGIFIPEEKTTSQIENAEFSETYTNINQIEIKTEVAKLTVKQSTDDLFKVEGYNLANKFSSKANGETLKVQESGNKNLFNIHNSTPEVIVYVPKDKTIDYLEMKIGVGTNIVKDITVEKFKLDGGAGTTSISNLTSNNTTINGGAGTTDIYNSKLNNLDLETGVGKVAISAKITGKSKIECGVGKTDISLVGSKTDYSIVTKTGIGKLSLDGKNCQDGYTYGNGNNQIKISAGVGAVDISFLGTSSKI